MDAPYPIQPGVDCSACTQSLASAQKLAEHMRKKHELLDTAPQDSQNTTLCAHTKVLVRLLLLKNCLDNCIKYGDGDRLCTALKFVRPIFKLNNNFKYAMAVVQFLAQIQYCVSPLLAAQLKYDRFVNMKGKNTVIIQQIFLSNTTTKNSKTSSLYLEEKPPRKHWIVYLKVKQKHKKL